MRLRFYCSLLCFLISISVLGSNSDHSVLGQEGRACLTFESLGVDDSVIKNEIARQTTINANTFRVFEHDSSISSDTLDIKTLEKKLTGFFNEPHANIGEALDTAILRNITPRALSSIIKSVLEDDKTLEHIAQRSYIHAMGFTKITLLTGPGHRPYKVRLHLWWPNQVPGPKMVLLEDKHVHKWDIASKMFSGSFEDQLYEIAEPTKAEEAIYERYIDALSSLSKAEQNKISNSLSIIEMAMYGQDTKFAKPKFRCSIERNDIYSKNDIMEKFNLNNAEFVTLLAMHQSYITQPNITGEYGLKKNGLKYLGYPLIKHIKKGMSYFHHHSLGHRLISDPDEMVATLVITTPPINDIEPYILMKEQEGQVMTKKAPILKTSTLKTQLNDFIKVLGLER